MSVSRATGNYPRVREGYAVLFIVDELESTQPSGQRNKTDPYTRIPKWSIYLHNVEELVTLQFTQNK